MWQELGRASSAATPHLIADALAQVLSQPEYRASITVRAADGESDDEIARICFSTDAFAVLAQDSDFFIYPLRDGCFYIPFHSLLATVVSPSGTSPAETIITGRGYSRALVCQTLGVDPRWTFTEPPARALSLFACLVGNDITNHSPWLDSFHARLRKLPQTSVRIAFMLI